MDWSDISRGGGEPLATTLLWRPWQFEREWIAWLASVNLLLPVLILPGLWVLWRRGGRYLGLAPPPFFSSTRSEWP